MKRRFATVILVLVFSCFLAACGAESESSDYAEKNADNLMIESTQNTNTQTEVENVLTESNKEDTEEADFTNTESNTEETTDSLTPDEYENILFGQPISTERDGEIRMGIKCLGGIYAKLSIYRAEGGKYNEIYHCDAVIGKNGPGKQAEGDVKTPLGSWVIGEAYGLKPDPGSLLHYTQVGEDDYWCATGSYGKKYNTLIHRSEDPDADYSEDEHLSEYPGLYDYFIDLGYNAGGAPYVGNAIFLHIWKDPDHYTGGCVGVSEESIIEILKLVPPGTVVTIYD